MSKLTAAFVRGTRKPGRYYDAPQGNGLFLQVDASGARRWGQRLTVKGRRAELGLGGFPLVSLAEAREAAFDNRKLARAGGDPLANRRRPAAPTFRAAVEAVIKLRAGGWRDSERTAETWRQTMEKHAYPALGDRSVAEVEARDIIEVLAPIWHTRPVVAKHVKQRIRMALAWAVAEGHRRDDLSTAVEAALPKQTNEIEHHRAVAHGDLARILASVQAGEAPTAVKLAIEFIALTACRSGEARLARWEEVDLESATWTTPGERMKAGKPHRVPLPARALAILAEARELADGSRLVFPGARGRPVGASSLRRVLEEAGAAATVHGLRSTFRDWAAECTNAPREVAEAALAHVVKSRVEAAYARSDLLDKRRRLMEQWADYLNAEPGARVVPMVRR